MVKGNSYEDNYFTYLPTCGLNTCAPDVPLSRPAATEYSWYMDSTCG